MLWRKSRDWGSRQGSHRDAISKELGVWESWSHRDAVSKESGVWESQGYS